MREKGGKRKEPKVTPFSFTLLSDLNLIWVAFFFLFYLFGCAGSYLRHTASLFAAFEFLVVAYGLVP